MSAPAIARLIRLLIPDARVLEKAHRQLRREFISQFLPARKFDEMLPGCSISIARCLAVAQSLDLAQRLSDKSLQFRVSRSRRMVLLHDEPPLRCVVIRRPPRSTSCNLMCSDPTGT